MDVEDEVGSSATPWESDGGEGDEDVFIFGSDAEFFCHVVLEVLPGFVSEVGSFPDAELCVVFVLHSCLLFRCSRFVGGRTPTGIRRH